MSKLPVLMYHNVSPNMNKGLTISCDKLEQQLMYLIQQNFTFLFASELKNLTKNAKKVIAITFDDVTQNQLDYAVPILKKHHVKATFFIPFNFVGKTDEWNQKNGSVSEKIMTISQLNSLDSTLIEFGHHSFFHQRYSQMSISEIEADFKKSNQFIIENNLHVLPTLAYPYGDFPKKGKAKEDFFSVLQKNQIQFAFRIGNRVNNLPLNNPFEIERIDVKGEVSLLKFKWKIKFGKLKLF